MLKAKRTEEQGIGRGRTEWQMEKKKGGGRLETKRQEEARKNGGQQRQGTSKDDAGNKKTKKV